MSQFDGNHTNSATQTEYHKLMMKVSLGCSEDMRNFARLVLGESVRVLKTKPACAFETVAIGSIARGEATPYSDLEYLFFIKNRAKKTVRYFEILAMTSYFLIGNLGETKLSYMAIEELHGWFDDKSKNGFKIDGLAKGAGNIPTGNDLKNVNHFIVTPKQLAKRYKTILDNPDPKEALRGDLTSIYTMSIYSYQNTQPTLLQTFQNSIKSMKLRQVRKDINMKMLQTDAHKFKFVPDHNLFSIGFNADVKRELFRFPSILLLDICIVSQCKEALSWQSLLLSWRFLLFSSVFVDCCNVYPFGHIFISRRS